MSDEIFVDKNKSDSGIYEQLIPQIQNLLTDTDANISMLSNFLAAIKQAFDKISWIGFYFLISDELILGPFQGKVACTKIKLGKGVCGTSANLKETIIVQDVNQFPGHIACDAESKSEIVVPLIKNDSLFGVLDIDSKSFSSFNQTDKFYLEKLVNLLMDKVDFENLKLN